MATPRLDHVLHKLVLQARRFHRYATRAFINWLLRGLFVIGRSRLAPLGFVLPTTVLLLLILSLTVGAISYRTFTRTSDAISDRQQRVIYNSATPAIDRAKAKLEFMFDRVGGDYRNPGSIPSEDTLLNLMYNDGRDGKDPIADITDSDDYTFPDETRVDLDGDGQWDNAWRYQVDRDGDGENDAWNIYSILFKTPQPTSTGYARIRLEGDAANPNTPIGIDDEAMALRADQLMVRNAPLSNSASSNTLCRVNDPTAGTAYGQGWFKDDNSPGIIRKNFQVDALVVPFNENGEFPAGSPMSSLEFQQDRVARTGNTWGAWFRNDLEIFPGPQFNWNGAMHSRGNIIVGDSNDRFKSFLISDPDSCLYTKDASRVTMAQLEANPDENVPAFQGQLINGSLKTNQYSGSSTFNLYDAADPDDNTERMTTAVDSVTTGGSPADFSLDPVTLLTAEVPQSRGWQENQGNNKVQSDRRDPAWEDTNFKRDDNRIFNRNEEIPYVDDSYRADNRYGPKARVKGGQFEIPDAPQSTDNPGAYDIGAPITGDKLAEKGVPDDDLIREESPASTTDAATAEALGLDGYWERRADYQGLKLIVGQRLELGNNTGWGGVDGNGVPALASAQNNAGRLAASRAEPLRPWNSCTGATGTVRANANRCNEARQRRMLRDNLAAVQAMAVYHYQNNNAGMPVACVASTVHPGTPDTLAKAATFSNWNPAGTYTNLRNKYPLAISNFFLGAGTNGWEFEPPAERDFATLSTPVMQALQNLAYYAGDPKGGAPSFPPVTNDNVVHPYPSMAMWGDFSLLRRVIMEMQDGTAYGALSPADKSTLHTAACTMGMLAYNIDYLNQLYADNLQFGDIRTASELSQVKNSSGIGDDLKELARRLGTLRTSNTFNPNIHTPDNYLYAYKTAFPPNTVQNRRLIALAEMFVTKEQARRDRQWGFLGTTGDGVVNGPKRDNDFFSPSCRRFIADSSGSNPLEPLVELCSDYPKYPLMAALFPTRTGTLSEDASNQYIRDREDIDGSLDQYTRSVNQNITYNRLTDADLADIALKPRAVGDWRLPKSTSTASGEPGISTVQPNNPNHPNLLLLKQCVTGNDVCLERTQVTGATLMRVAFKDAALMNGREMMSVRSLDLDLELLRDTQIGNNYWLPAEERAGVIYAFREDGVREGAIVRPSSNAAWTTCGNNNAIQNNVACRMRTGDTNAYNSTDPPLAPNGISPKPVDYYPDPDRRPHAFRLKNGRKLERPNKAIAGLTLVSDNPVYIMGDFNLHLSGGAEVEEFYELLTIGGNGNIGNFYKRNRLNPNFARSNRDQWRPAEVLADAITLLPINFCDGSIQDGFGIGTGNAASNYGCANSGNNTSYENQNTPNNNPNRPNRPPSYIADGWLRENPFATPNSPVRVSRDGNPIKAAGSFTNTTYNALAEFGADNTETYVAFADPKNKKINAPVRTNINAVIVSGLVPSRPNQSYGGMHNFPRFINTWGKLYISGSLIQLNFSNSATAPFDQDAWEPGQAAQGAEEIEYYGAPDRIWGYDVGLQYAPPGPLSSRFASVENSRSEYYSEPALDDPYVTKLCDAMQGLVENLPCE